ncbi:Prp18 domain containing protein, putative [Angomonas deanei]|uniref:Pre-mRNA-splicing factor 18 n=1 Tax=Angomonas deanei TaxID=59799 RepID=A0A7G2CF07_9TRYP|nr:Prp18 domain containing protein, putative [Angomonas deanei]
MSNFDDLKNRLKKKKELTANAPSKPEVHNDSSLYDKVIQEVKVASVTEEVAAPPPPRKRAREALSVSPDRNTTPPPEVPVLSSSIHTEEAFERHRADALRALATVLAQSKPNFPITDSTENSFFPQAVADFLTDLFIRQTVEVHNETERLEAEEKLLRSLHGTPASDPTFAKPLPPAEKERLTGLRQFILSLWYLIASHWVHAVEGSADGEGRYDYLVYRFLYQQLPEEVKYTAGRTIALATDRWRRLQKTRWQSMELLAYCLHDYHTGVTGATESPIVPADMSLKLHHLLVLTFQVRHHYAEARQAYVDLTHGNADWKMGLYTGGEVHMRRSLERVDRNRVSHLLNNEHAVSLLHGLMEMIRFGETEMEAADKAVFFSTSTGTP